MFNFDHPQYLGQHWYCGECVMYATGTRGMVNLITCGQPNHIQVSFWNISWWESGNEQLPPRTLCHVGEDRTYPYGVLWSLCNGLNPFQAPSGFPQQSKTTQLVLVNFLPDIHRNTQDSAFRWFREPMQQHSKLTYPLLACKQFIRFPRNISNFSLERNKTKPESPGLIFQGPLKNGVNK